MVTVVSQQASCCGLTSGLGTHAALSDVVSCVVAILCPVQHCGVLCDSQLLWMLFAVLFELLIAWRKLLFLRMSQAHHFLREIEM